MSKILDYFQPLFYPRSAAVLGASNFPGKWGFVILHNLITGGFPGPLFPVNRKGGVIQGLPAFASINDLPAPPDLGLIVLPPAAVLPALGDLVRIGTRAGVIITGGFGEASAAGAVKEAEITRIAGAAGIPVIGPNCQGIMCAPARLYAQFLFLQPEPGPLSIVSQSGNVGGSIIHYGVVNGIGFNKFLSTGNEAATGVLEALDYFREDESTRAVIMYVEGVSRGRDFLEALRRLSLVKPVVALKAGVTAAGSRACASHTGALAGDVEVVTAALRQAGAILVTDLDEAFWVAAAAIAQPLPRGRRVGIVTLGGGWGVLAADACAREGLEVVPLPAETVAALDGFLADRWSRQNPVDLAATPEQDAMKKALELVAASPAVDSLLQTNLGFGGAFQKYVKQPPIGMEGWLPTVPPRFVDFLAGHDLVMAETIVALIRQHQKPIVSCTDIIMGDSIHGNPTLEFMSRHGLCVYPTPAQAARVLARITAYAEWRRKAQMDPPQAAG